MKTTELERALSLLIPARESVLIAGPPGVGKTSIVEQAASACGMELLVSHPTVSDPTDYKGIPYVDASGADWKPTGDLKRLVEADSPTVALFDDLGQASPAVQAAAMQLLLARRIGEHRVSDHVTFCACTNRREDRAGVAGFLEPVKSRFATILNVDCDPDGWAQWFLTQSGLHVHVLAFIRLRPDMLLDFAPTADLKNSPSPRTWEAVARIESIPGIDNGLRLPLISGAVGESACAEYLAFTSMISELPSIDAILIDPHGSDLPNEPSALFAVCTALVSRCNVQTTSAVITYANRLMQAHGEFGVLLVRDSVRRFPGITNCADFIKWATDNADVY